MKDGTENAPSEVLGKVVFAHHPGKETEAPEKEARRAALLRKCGLENEEAVASPFPRVSLLAREALEKVTAEHGITVWPGFCGEDICTEDVDYDSLHVGSFLRVGSALLVITRKGKDCGGKCAVSQKTLDCPLSQSWVSAWVLREGEIRIEDPVSVLSVESDVVSAAGVA